MNIADAKYVIEKNPERYFWLTGRHDALLREACQKNKQ